MKTSWLILLLLTREFAPPANGDGRPDVPPAFGRLPAIAEKAGELAPTAESDPGGVILTIAHPSQRLTQARTTVWSPVFQAAWDIRNETFGGPPTRVVPPNALMSELDSFRWNPAEVFPNGSWKAWCGLATRDFLQHVNAEAATITGEAEGPFDLAAESDDAIAYFALLDHAVEFERGFSQSRSLAMNFNDGWRTSAVSFFGTRGKSSGMFAKSVRVLAYHPPGTSHALRIACKEPGDALILYLPQQPQDLVSACRWIRVWRSPNGTSSGRYGDWNNPSIHATDDLRIPYLNLAASAEFHPELAGVRFYGEFETRIARAEQKSRFEMTEKGARVRVTASGEDPFAGEPPKPFSRKFIYDRPFFVFLWKDEAEWPYFAAWIGDISGLVPFLR